MSDDLETRVHHAITHNHETHIKLSDASVTFSLYRKNIATQAVRIAELEAKVNAVYSERNRLASAFARMALAVGFKAGKGVDPDETKWPVVYVDTPNGQVSWHIAEQDADVLSGLPEYGGEWDGQFRSRDPLWPVWEITSPITAKDARIAELEAALNQAKQHFRADEPLKAFIEICAALVGGEDE